MRRFWTVAMAIAQMALWSHGALADLTTLTRRDREDPSVGATLVFDLARKRLVSSSGIGDTILFRDRDVPLRVTASEIA